MMFQKDEEIDRLNVKLATLANQIPSGQLESDKATVNQLKTVSFTTFLLPIFPQILTSQG